MGVLPSLRPQPLPFTMAGGEAAGAPAPIVQVVTDLDDGTRPAGVGVAGLEWAETVNGRQCNVFRPSPGVERPAVQPLDATSVPFDASGPGPSIPSPGEGRWVAAIRPKPHLMASRGRLGPEAGKHAHADSRHADSPS